MVEDRHELDVSPVELLAELRSLRVLVEGMLRQLPDQAIEFAVDGIRDHARKAQHRVQETQNDKWRDYAAVAYDMAERIGEDVELYVAEKSQGARHTTIQATPVSREDLHLRTLTDED